MFLLKKQLYTLGAGVPFVHPDHGSIHLRGTDYQGPIAARVLQQFDGLLLMITELPKSNKATIADIGLVGQP